MDFKREINGFWTFIKQNRWAILICFAVFISIWGPWIYNTNPRIDSEVVINEPDSLVGWQTIGRQGFLFTELFMGLSTFNPHVYTLVGYVFVFISSVLLSYILWTAGKGNSTIYLIAVTAHFLNPIFAEQFYFDLQIMQVGWGFIITALGCGLAYYGIIRRSVLACLLSVLCMIWSFSSYQAFVIVYIAEVATLCILEFWNRISNGYDLTVKAMFRLIWLNVALFILAYLVNHAITKLWFATSDYLNNQRLWGTQATRDIISFIKSSIITGLLGRDIFHSIWFLILSSTGVCTAIFVLQKKSVGFTVKFLLLCAVAALQFIPFILTVYLGQEPTVRAQFTYPFVLWIDLLLICEFLNHYKHFALKLAVSLVAVVMAFSQIRVTMRLIYTDEVRTEEDKRIIEQLDTRIKELSSNKKVAFVGVYTNHLNASCIKGEVIGESALNWDAAAYEKYWRSSWRICEMMKTLGYEIENVSQDQIMSARLMAVDMPCWPEVGSVVDEGEYILVKLSEDEFSQEIIDKCLQAELSDDNNTLTLTLNNYHSYDGIRFAVWSEENGQDDLAFYEAARQDEGTWKSVIELSGHPSSGFYNIHVFTQRNEDQTFVGAKTITT